MPKDNRIGDGYIPEKSLMGLPWRYAIGCIDRLGLILRAEVIWSKESSGMPDPVTDRVRRSHENWFHLVKSLRYFGSVDDTGSVWTVPTEPLVIPDHLGDHNAAFPQELPRRIILGWSPPGGVVADVFGGTGTTAGVAHVLGRHGISIDLSADYCRLAQWRIGKSGHFNKSEEHAWAARAEQRTWADRQESLR
jgi:DNA modification methylase